MATTLILVAILLVFLGVAWKENGNDERRLLHSRLAQAEKECEALLFDLHQATKEGAVCTACRHNAGLNDACVAADLDCKQCKAPCMCRDCTENGNYEWRGVCEENTHDQP